MTQIIIGVAGIFPVTYAEIVIKVVNDFYDTSTNSSPTKARASYSHAYESLLQGSMCVLYITTITYTTRGLNTHFDYKARPNLNTYIYPSSRHNFPSIEYFISAQQPFTHRIVLLKQEGLMASYNIKSQKLQLHLITVLYLIQKCH